MSRHLAALRALGVVEDSRVANRVFYRLHPALPGWARGVVDHLAAGVTATHELRRDCGAVASDAQPSSGTRRVRLRGGRHGGRGIGHAV